MSEQDTSNRSYMKIIKNLLMGVLVSPIRLVNQLSNQIAYIGYFNIMKVLYCAFVLNIVLLVFDIKHILKFKLVFYTYGSVSIMVKLVSLFIILLLIYFHSTKGVFIKRDYLTLELREVAVEKLEVEILKPEEKSAEDNKVDFKLFGKGKQDSYEEEYEEEQVEEETESEEDDEETDAMMDDIFARFNVGSGDAAKIGMDWLSDDNAYGYYDAEEEDYEDYEGDISFERVGNNSSSTPNNGDRMASGKPSIQHNSEVNNIEENDGRVGMAKAPKQDAIDILKSKMNQTSQPKKSSSNILDDDSYSF